MQQRGISLKQESPEMPDHPSFFSKLGKTLQNILFFFLQGRKQQQQTLGCLTEPVSAGENDSHGWRPCPLSLKLGRVIGLLFMEGAAANQKPSQYFNLHKRYSLVTLLLHSHLLSSRD